VVEESMSGWKNLWWALATLHKHRVSLNHHQSHCMSAHDESQSHVVRLLHSFACWTSLVPQCSSTAALHGCTHITLLLIIAHILLSCTHNTVLMIIAHILLSCTPPRC
jgi:hypothetical protein